MWYLCPPIYLSLTTGSLPVIRKSVFISPNAQFFPLRHLHQCLSLKLALLLWSWWLQVHLLRHLLFLASLSLTAPKLPGGTRQPVVVLAVFFMTASITLTGEFVCRLLWLWWSLLYLLSIHFTNHPPNFLLQLAGFPKYIGYCKQNERESGLLYVVCTFLLFAASRCLVCNLGSLHLICSASLALFSLIIFTLPTFSSIFIPSKKQHFWKWIEWLFETIQLKRMTH